MHNDLITNLFEDWAPKKPSVIAQLLNKLAAIFGIQSRIGPSHPITGYMSCVEQRMNMFHLASQVVEYDIPGDFVELGCHAGQSAVLLQKVIDSRNVSRTLYVYDSFEGLPDPTEQDVDIKCFKGNFKIAKQQMIQNFDKTKTRLPVINEGWFKDTLPDALPEQIAFAHLDGDLYASIKISLEYVYPKLSKGGVCLIHDYCDLKVFPNVYDEFPGVKKAVDEYLADKPEKISCLYCGPNFSHAYFIKK
jgi:O-methyltransferase